ncbi:MAG: toll/interleukin-1 receptor domain-containing protein [Gammaproteobacteria bacterium]
MEIREFDWDELLALIEAQEVIPVLGRDLLSTVTAEGRQLYHRQLAQKLAIALNVPETSLAPDYQLNEVAMAFLKSGGRRHRIYSRLKTVLDETPVAIPSSLLKIAEITDFNLYLSTTFDDLLSQALNQVRYRGAASTRTLSYSLHDRSQDLLQTYVRDKGVYVFQVFGVANRVTDYAVTDEDMLEFLHRLQEDAYRPERLFDELYNHNLLLIGCGFPDWLARFFIRTLSRQRLMVLGDTTRFVVDREIKTDSSLMLFLRDWYTEIYPEGEPEAFIDELHRRWRQRNSASSPLVKEEPVSMLPGSIFLSYSREDQKETKALHAVLEQAGMDVWYDECRLGSGDAWERRIQDNILNCSLFLPIISRNAAERMEGFYRREWHMAINRAYGFADHVPFIIPIIIDDTPPGFSGVPAYFWDRQLERAPGGLPTSEVIGRLRNALRQHQLQHRG